MSNELIQANSIESFEPLAIRDEITALLESRKVRDDATEMFGKIGAVIDDKRFAGYLAATGLGTAAKQMQAIERLKQFVADEDIRQTWIQINGIIGGYFGDAGLLEYDQESVYTQLTEKYQSRPDVLLNSGQVLLTLVSEQYADGQVTADVVNQHLTQFTQIMPDATDLHALTPEAADAALNYSVTAYKAVMRMIAKNEVHSGEQIQTIDTMNASLTHLALVNFNPDADNGPRVPWRTQQNMIKSMGMIARGVYEAKTDQDSKALPADALRQTKTIAVSDVAAWKDQHPVSLDSYPIAITRQFIRSINRAVMSSAEREEATADLCDFLMYTILTTDRKSPVRENPGEPMTDLAGDIVTTLSSQIASLQTEDRAYAKLLEILTHRVG